MKQKLIFILCLLIVFSAGIYAQTAKSRTEPLKVGAVAPDFTLTDQNGKRVTLSKAKNPTVLVFYRGYW